ncbi:hypothetical protein [Catenulispora pinisilvae]|uniref:hypothetical protein n=1 Tax=Catenulispora pinisilvae TaxID=2705253 RepID=UPI00189160EF|nr:hypothetical protein [Catenulispora pinisilvae]
MSVGGRAAVQGTGAVGAFIDNTIYPASAGPISWAGPVTTLRWQKDGNLVLYKKDGRPIWASDTAGNPGATLAPQNNGSLVIRPGMPLMNSTGMLIGTALWFSGTTGTNTYALVEQTDGNAVLDSPTGATFGTNGNVERTRHPANAWTATAPRCTPTRAEAATTTSTGSRRGPGPAGS